MKISMKIAVLMIALAAFISSCQKDEMPCLGRTGTTPVQSGSDLRTGDPTKDGSSNGGFLGTGDQVATDSIVGGGDDDKDGGGIVGGGDDDKDGGNKRTNGN